MGTHRRVYEAFFFVKGIFTDPEPRSLKHGQRPRDLARRSTTLILPHGVQSGLHADDGLRHTRAADRLAIIHWRQAGDVPLGDAIGRVDAGGVGGLDEVLGDDVEDALARVDDVAQCVLGAGPAREAHHEQRRVVVHDVEVAEGREVGGEGVGAAGAEEGDGPGDDGGGEELVIERGAAAGLVGVDGDVFW